MKLSKLFFGLIVLIGFVLMFGLVGSVDSSAAPKGLRDDCLGKKIASFNVILKPNQWDENGNGCNGSRMFFYDDGSMNFGRITWLLDPSAHGLTIDDCDGTDGDAHVTVDESQDFVIAIRLLGPVPSTLDLTCTVTNNPTVTGNEDLCIIDGVQSHINRNSGTGTSFTKISGNIADNEMEGITYDLDGDWKIFQVWLVEWDGSNCL